MSKVRVLKNLNGTVSVVHPSFNCKKQGETDQDFLIRVFSKATPSGAIYEDIDTADLPSTREDRSFWEFDNSSKKVKVNAIKKQAKEDEKLAKQAIKDSAKSKLGVLGLTQEEIETLTNG